MIKINLLPVRAAQKQENIRKQIVIVVLVFSVLLASIIYAHISIKEDIKVIDRNIKAVEKDIKALEGLKAEVEEFKNKKSELLDKLKVIETLRNSKTGPVVALDTLSKLIPKKMWFESIKQKNNMYEIEGIAMDNNIIAEFLANLKTNKYFVEDNVDLKHSKQVDYEGKSLMSFKITCVFDANAKSKVVTGTKGKEGDKSKPESDKGTKASDAGNVSGSSEKSINVQVGQGKKE